MTEGGLDMRVKLLLLALLAAAVLLSFFAYHSPAMAYLLSEFRIC